MTTQRKHAIVLGAGVAGLLAARALTDHYSRVTLLEHDVLPKTAEPRKGVPQGRHTHGLLSRGGEILEEFFPGFTADLETQGAVVADLPRDTRWHLGGGYLAQAPMATGLVTLLASRPMLEQHLRNRLLALPNVSAIEGCTVLGLETSPDQSQVVGVRIRHDLADLEMVMRADLVVDATGRGSRLPAWLQSLGYSAPEEERVEVKIGYASQMYRRATSLPTGAAAVVGSSEPGANRSGLYVPIEGDRWMVTLTGYLGDYPPTDEEGLRDFAWSIPTLEVAALVEHAEPLGPPTGYRFPGSLRRRYERLRHFPDGLLVLGDAMCSFNPVYGQGMTVAALEATLLGKCLARGTRRLAHRFFSAAASIIDTPWSMAVGADLRFPEVDGPRGLQVRFLNWYIGRLQYAARSDWRVALTFLQVSNMINPPTSLMGPTTLWRVLRAHFRQVGSKLPAQELDFSLG